MLLLGSTVLLGYVLHAPTLVQIVPGMLAMAANTAFTFILLSLALLIETPLATWQSLLKTGLLFAVIVFAILSVLDGIVLHHVG